MKTNRIISIMRDGIERYFPSAIARRTALLFLIGGILAFLIIPEVFLARAVQSKAVKMNNRLTELTALGKEYVFIKERVDAVQKKSSLTRVNSVTASFDSIITALGMKAKMKTVKSSRFIAPMILKPGVGMPPMDAGSEGLYIGYP